MPAMPTEPPRLLTLPLLARRLRVTVRWLRGEAEAGRVPAVRADRTFLFNSEAVEQALLDRAAEERASTAAGVRA